MADTLKHGLEQQIEQLLTEHPATKLVVIDPTYTGTPSALSAKIDPDGRLGITPKKVARLALESVDSLRKNGILISFRKSNGERLISLLSAESDDLPTVGNIDPNRQLRNSDSNGS